MELVKSEFELDMKFFDCTNKEAQRSARRILNELGAEEFVEEEGELLVREGIGPDECGEEVPVPLPVIAPVPLSWLFCNNVISCCPMAEVEASEAKS